MRPSTCPKTFFCALFFLAFFLLSTSYAQATAAPKGTGNLHVTSDKLVAEKGNSMVEFIGSVRAVRDDAVLLADSVKIFFKPKDKDKGDKGRGNVDKIVATGHVEYTAGERKAYADKAVYTTADEKLVLTGENPRLLTGKSWVTGRKITLFRTQERVMVESDGKKRVQAFFDSQDQNTGQGKGGAE